jgi:hypothetical protein
MNIHHTIQQLPTTTTTHSNTLKMKSFARYVRKWENEFIFKKKCNYRETFKAQIWKIVGIKSHISCHFAKKNIIYTMTLTMKVRK